MGDSWNINGKTGGEKKHLVEEIETKYEMLIKFNLMSDMLINKSYWLTLKIRYYNQYEVYGSKICRSQWWFHPKFGNFLGRNMGIPWQFRWCAATPGINLSDDNQQG